MKNYFQKILSLFVNHDYPTATEEHFYRWLADSEHANEKDKALHELWVTCQKQGESTDWQKSLEQWKRANGFVQPSRPTRTIGRVLPLRLWQSAAAVLLIVSISLVYWLNRVEKTEVDLVQQFIPTAEMKIFFLPDGSQVQMNSRSTLLYPQQFNGKNRSVYLVGEANFKVKPDKEHPFIVKSTDFQVTALGTEFNISAYADAKEISATLIEGSVLVEYDNLTQRTLLQPNEQLIYHKGTHSHTIGTINIDDVTAWQRGELIFREMTLHDIITVLERKYDYQFIYSLHSLKKDRYSFRFKDEASLPIVMDVIVDVVGNLKFRIQGDKCYIMRK